MLNPLTGAVWCYGLFPVGYTPPVPSGVPQHPDQPDTLRTGLIEATMTLGLSTATTVGDLVETVNSSAWGKARNQGLAVAQATAGLLERTGLGPW